MLVTLLRFAAVSTLSSVNNEASPPIGLAYIASICKLEGVEVKGIDATGKNPNKYFKIPKHNLQGNGIEIEEVIDLIDKNTDVIGISAMFTYEWAYVKDCINEVKIHFPNALIIVGGEHVTALPEYCLRDCKSIDYILLGEGETTWSEIIIKKKKGENDFAEINGIAYLEKNNFKKTSDRQRIKHMNNIPWPDWKVFPIEPYLDNAISFGAGSGRNMPMLASRGCPFECTFCSNPIMFGRRYYIRDVEDVIKEIKYYIEKYNITGIQFYDLTAIVKKSWVLEFCEALKKNDIDLDWSLPSGTRSEALDSEVLDSLSSVNLKYLVYAPESGSKKTLELIKKKVKLPILEKSVRYAIKKGISVRTNLIIGFPHETRLQLYRTFYQQLKFVFMGVEECPCFIFMAYPGTEIFDNLVKNNKIRLNDEYFNSLAQSISGKLSPPGATYNKYMGRYEIYFYWVLGLFLSYSLVYLTRPKRIIRTFKSFFTDESSSVIEQRLKDLIRKRLKNLIRKFKLSN